MYQKEFALKKIRCPAGAEDVEAVMHEVAAYRRFKCVFSLLFTRASYMTMFQAPQHYPIICVLSFCQRVCRLTLLQDSAVLQDSDGDGKVVYLFLPLYQVRFSALRLGFPAPF